MYKVCFLITKEVVKSEKEKFFIRGPTTAVFNSCTG